jgi:hypothetical protein
MTGKSNIANITPDAFIKELRMLAVPSIGRTGFVFWRYSTIIYTSAEINLPCQHVTSWISHDFKQISRLRGIAKVGKDSWGLSFYCPEWECRCVRFKDTILQQPLKSSFSNQT